MGLAAASVPNLSTDAARIMAPALTEPVTQSDISGQSPRPGDSITSHTDTQTPTSIETATENQRNLLNNGKNKFLANGQSTIVSPLPSIIKNNNCKLTSVQENHLTAPDDQVSSRSRRSSSAHMDQSESSKGAVDQDATPTPPQPSSTTTSLPSLPPPSSTIENETELSQQQQFQQFESQIQPQLAQLQSLSPATQESLSIKSLDDNNFSDQIIKQSDIDALATVNNNMGLSKDASDVEQMLGDLAASGDIDLLSVIKTLESNPSEAGFDLAGGLSLFNDDEAMNVYEDVQAVSPSKENQKVEEMRQDLIKRQAQMKRKCDFLMRRLKKLQAQCMMEHASEEIAGLLEHTQRFMKDQERERSEKKPGIDLSQPSTSSSSILSEVLPYQPPPGTAEEKVINLRPVSGPAMRQLVKRLDTTAAFQRATLSKRQLGCKYFSSQLTEPPVISSATAGTTRIPLNTYTTVPRFEDKVIEQIDSMSGLLHAELRIVEKALDSDATASSSGGESADEMIVYSNPTQEKLKM